MIWASADTLGQAERRGHQEQGGEGQERPDPSGDRQVELADEQPEQGQSNEMAACA